MTAMNRDYTPGPASGTPIDQLIGILAYREEQLRTMLADKARKIAEDADRLAADLADYTREPMVNELGVWQSQTTIFDTYAAQYVTVRNVLRDARQLRDSAPERIAK